SPMPPPGLADRVSGGSDAEARPYGRLSFAALPSRLTRWHSSVPGTARANGQLHRAVESRTEAIAAAQHSDLVVATSRLKRMSRPNRSRVRPVGGAGAVMLIGGAEDKLKGKRILSRFVRVAGGGDADRLGVVS